MFKYYNHLGFYNPYYINKDSQLMLSPRISQVLEFKNTPNELDLTAVLSIMTKGFIIGDRSLIKSVNKSPWYSREKKGQWDFYKEVEFGSKILEKDQIVKELLRLLQEEILDYIGESKDIGILLSGGMDSRMIAGILQLLIKKQKIQNVNVIALTWGHPDSRDVVYSKRIASEMGWSWKHFDIVANDFIDNIKMTASRGCEYSPNHLHAMLKIREEEGIDCILAGSFGDSIGRGEYSGKTVLQLDDIRKNIDNRSGFLKNNSILEGCKLQIDRDVEDYWKIFPQKLKYQQIEQDYQIHYMRRLLNPCLSLINEKIPVYQAFSNPKVVKFMWSLDPKLRNNDIYLGLLHKFDSIFHEIPWARTGLVFGSKDGVKDNYLRSYESNIYSSIFKNEILDYVEGLVLNGRMNSLQVFNWKSLKNTFKIIKSPLYKDNLALEERLTWLASLSLFIEKYDITSKTDLNRNSDFQELIESNYIYYESLKYYFKYTYRKVWLKKD